MKLALPKMILPVISLSLIVLSACAGNHYIHEYQNSASLYFHAPRAREVLFVSSLDRFQPHPARKILWMTWKVSVPADQEFIYFYLVDGVAAVPDCPLKIRDDFGADNCLFVPGL